MDVFLQQKTNQKRKEQNHEDRKSNSARSDSLGAGNARNGATLAQRWRRWQPRRLVDEQPQTQWWWQPQLQLAKPQLQQPQQLKQQKLQHAKPQLQQSKPQHVKKQQRSDTQLQRSEPLYSRQHCHA